jgi:hypothetical protein
MTEHSTLRTMAYRPSAFTDDVAQLPDIADRIARALVRMGHPFATGEFVRQQLALDPTERNTAGQDAAALVADSGLAGW